MSTGTLAGRILQLLLALGGPAAVAGYAVDGPRGAIAAALLLGGLLALAAWRSEAAIVRAYRGREAPPEGVRRSLARVLAARGGAEPGLKVFAEPGVLALVARSPGGPGTILLSEGLLGLLSEEELRDLLDLGITRLRTRGIGLQSVCGWLAHALFGLAPRGWMELVHGKLEWHESLSPFNALRYLAASSAARFFVRLGAMTRSASDGSGADAPRPYQRLSRWSGHAHNPGSGILHLVNPWR